MKLAMVILYLYSYRGGLIAHDHFITMDQCEAAAEEVVKFTKRTNLLFPVCIPQMPDK